MFGSVYSINWILVNWYKVYFRLKSVTGIRLKNFTLLLLDLVYDFQLEKKYIDHRLDTPSKLMLIV